MLDEGYICTWLALPDWPLMAALREAKDPFLGNDDEDEDPFALTLLVALVSRLPDPELPPAVMSVPPCRDPLLLPKLALEPDLE